MLYNNSIERTNGNEIMNMQTVVEGAMFDLFLFDTDNGNLINVVKGVSGKVAVSVSEDYVHSNGYAVKMVDQEDGVVVATFGM